MTAPQANWDLSFDRHKLQELRSSWGGSSDRLGRRMAGCCRLQGLVWGALGWQQRCRVRLEPCQHCLHVKCSMSPNN